MRQVNIKTLKKNLSSELQDLPFEITRYSKHVACIFAPDTSKSERSLLFTEIDDLNYERDLQNLQDLELSRLYKADKKKAKLIRRLKKNGCMICGYDKSFRGLHFHHINGKSNEIRRIGAGEIQEEFKKYDIVLLCANCHAEVHDNKLDISHLKSIKINDKVVTTPKNEKKGSHLVKTVKEKPTEIIKKKKGVHQDEATIATGWVNPLMNTTLAPKGK